MLEVSLSSIAVIPTMDTYDYDFNIPIPFPLHVDDELLSVTKQKLELARFPKQPIDVPDDDWSQGTNLKVVQRLAAYWKDGYDWWGVVVVFAALWTNLRCEAYFVKVRINDDFNNFKVKVDILGYGPQVLHFAHQRSPRSDAIPLLVAHGWPGSFLESRKINRPLTQPDDPSSPAFHLVCPSIPGFGPGDAPSKIGFGQVLTARAFKAIMVDVLGYERFVTQGGDWGALITRSMAMQYPQHICACHFNIIHV